MHTLESAYIFPIIFITTIIFIISALNTHDMVVSNAVQYYLLIDNATALENPIYGPTNAYTKSQIEDIVYNLYLTKKRPSFIGSFSGNTLYLQDDGNKSSLPVFFSNYERCETIRKETALILQYIKDE